MEIGFSPSTGQYFGKKADGTVVPLQIGTSKSTGAQFYRDEDGSVKPLPDIRASYDDKTGAGWRERYIIGSASDDKTRMERARAIWGDDAKMDSDGRVMFRNPETSRWTYVNPKGLDWGDLAGVGREAVSMAAGIPATVFALPSGLGALVAGSTASAAGGQAADMVAAKMARDIARERGNPVPEMQSVPDALKETAIDTGFGMAGGALFGGIGKLVKGALNPLDQGYVAAFRNAGVDIPTIGTGSGGKWASMYEGALGGMTGAVGTMDKATRKAQEQLTESLIRTADDIAGGRAASTITELGEAGQKAAKRSLEAFRAENNRFYDDIHKTWGTAPANLNNTFRTIGELTYGRGLADETAYAEAKKLASLLGQEAADNAKGELNVATLGNLRTRIGEMLSNPSALETAGVDKAKLRAIYGSLSDDYSAAITDPAARNALTAHKAWESAQHAARESLEPIFNAGKGDATAIGKKLASTNLTPQQVTDMRFVLGDGDFGKLSGGILRNSAPDLSSQGVEGVVSPTQLSKVLTPGRGQSYQPETVAALWGNKTNDLRTVADALSNSARNANTSRTAQTSGMMSVINSPWKLLQGGGLLGASYGAATGNPAALAGAVGSVAGPWGLAKATTNRAIIDYLAKPQGAASRALFNSGAMPYLGIQGGLLTRFEADK